MIDPLLNRRNFLVTSGSAVTGSWLSRVFPVIFATAQVACSKREEGQAFVNLDPFDAADLEAIAEQILPTNETPGAREAGVIWFMDESFGGFLSAMSGPVREGLNELNAGLESGRRFADLGWEKQKSALQAIETTPFFNMVHFLTVAGMFALPGYGGNRDKLGWALLGFEDHHAWQPPFGYYDAAYTPEVSS